MYRGTQGNMITYQQEKAADGWDEFIPLVVDHCAEIGQEPPDLDKDVLLALEEMDQLRCYTVRDDGKAVGYAIYIIDTNIMQRGRVIARDLGLFLAESHRNSGIAGKLLDIAETSMASEGVAEIYQSIPAGSPVGALLGSLGYDLIEEVHRKILVQPNEDSTRVAHTR